MSVLPFQGETFVLAATPGAALRLPRADMFDPFGAEGPPADASLCATWWRNGNTLARQLEIGRKRHKLNTPLPTPYCCVPVLRERRWLVAFYCGWLLLGQTVKRAQAPDQVEGTQADNLMVR